MKNERTRLLVVGLVLLAATVGTVAVTPTSTAHACVSSGGDTDCCWMEPGHVHLTIDISRCRPHAVN